MIFLTNQFHYLVKLSGKQTTIFFLAGNQEISFQKLIDYIVINKSIFSGDQFF